MANVYQSQYAKIAIRALNTDSASYALTASYAMNGGGGGGTPGGSNTTVQFNDAGAFSGSGNFTFDKTTNAVRITGSAILSGSVFMPGLTGSTAPQVLLYNTTTGRVSYTASSAFGGAGSSPGGPYNTIQFNDVGNFNGSSSFTFNGSNLVTLTGSMIVSGAISASYGPNTVGFYGTASWAQSASQAISSSYSLSSSYALSSSYSLSSSYALSASYALSSSYALSASYALSSSYAFSSSYSLSSSYALSASYALSSSYALSASYALSSSYSLSSSYALSASYALSSSYALSASYASGSTSASYALTASYALAFKPYPINVTGSTLYSVDPVAFFNGVPANSIGSIFFGVNAGQSVGAFGGKANYTIGIGASAGQNNSYGDISDSVFIGGSAGGDSGYASQSVFIGAGAGYFATYAHRSNFIGYGAGQYQSYTDESFNIAPNSGSYSNYIGYGAGTGYLDTSFGINRSPGRNNTIIGTSISLPNDTSNYVNLGGAFFISGTYFNGSTLTPGLGPSSNILTGSVNNAKVGINLWNPNYSLHVSGTVAFPNLTNQSQVNVVVIDTASGQLFYTASSAIGGGGSGTPGGPNKSIQFNSNQTFSGSSNFIFDSASNSMILTGSMITTGSNLLIGTTTLTGSLNVSGSTTQTGNNTLIGNTVLSGSIRISGSSDIVGTTTMTGSLSITGSTTQTGNNTLIGNTLLTGSITISGSNPPGSLSASVQIYGDIRQSGYHRFDPVTTNIDTSISASYIYVSGSTQDMYFSQNGNGYNNVTRLRWLEAGALYTGLLRGGIISSTPGTTTFKITSGSGLLVTMNASTGSEPYPTVQYISWPDYNVQPIIYSGSAKITYVGISSAGTIIQQTVPWGTNDINQWDNSISLGVVLHLSGSVSTGVFNAPQISYGEQQKTDDFFRAFGPLKISGHTLLPSGSTLGLKKLGGTSYREGANYAINPNHPSTVVENDITTSKIYRYYLSGSTPVIDTGVANAGYTFIDPTQYVDTATGQLTTVSGNNSNQWRWTIQRVFWVPNSPTNAFIVYYGNAQYTTLVDVKNAIDTEPFSEAPNTAQNAIFIGYILVRKGCTDLSDTTGTNAVLVQGGLFRNVGGNGGSGTSAATTLSSLSDVTITSPSYGDLLMYDTTVWNNTKQLTGSYGLTGSLTVTQNISASSFTGSLFGTASYVSGSVFTSANPALSASYALTASYVLQAVSSSFASTASFVTASNVWGPFGTSSVASASYASSSLSASYAATSSYAQTLTIQSTLTTFTSSITVLGVNTLFTQSTSSYNSAFGKYTIASASNARAGEFVTVWNSGSIRYYDNSTTDIGSTSNVTFSSSFSGANILLQTSASAGWQVKILTTFI